MSGGKWNLALVRIFLNFVYNLKIFTTFAVGIFNKLIKLIT